ncbi:MAG: HAD family hydrolase [Collinsella sp.]
MQRHLTHLSADDARARSRRGRSRIQHQPAGLNKGVAIARFCEHLGIEREETLALGDSSPTSTWPITWARSAWSRMA